MATKINVIIEVKEATSFSVHPISGRSGRNYGFATLDAKRGTMCFRMSLDEWREAREDLCLSRHRFYPLIWDVEVEDDPTPNSGKKQKK